MHGVSMRDGADHGLTSPRVVQRRRTRVERHGWSSVGKVAVEECAVGERREGQTGRLIRLVGLGVGAWVGGERVWRGVIPRRRVGIAVDRSEVKRGLRGGSRDVRGRCGG